MIEHTVDLPFPVSVNRIWARRKTGVYRSSQYKQWIIQADKQILVDKILRGAQTITGKFDTRIYLNRDMGRLDADNAIKILMDFCQKRGLISNDKNQNETTIRWVSSADAPIGCRIFLKEVPQ